jgi:capsular polysaccharide biosynthesis protein
MSITNNLPNDNRLQGENDGISLTQIVQFLGNSWKTIFLFAVLGLFVSAVYILIVPNQYEAIAQLKMAQISITNPTNPFGTTIEDPNSLIARMKLPTNYSSEVITACEYQDKVQASLALSKAVKLTIPKGLTNSVELKVLSESTQIAKTCAQAVVDQITLLQAQFAKPFVEEAKLKLVQDNDRIEAARRLIARADQSGSAMSAAYLAARDELTYFLTDREKMLDLINSVDKRGTQLISPIYIAEKPASPKKMISLFAGLFGGIILGLGVALVRQLLRGENVQENAGASDA